ncbi:MAG: hypothetical protein WBN68_03220 [Sedimenticolaceae bacterium]
MRNQLRHLFGFILQPFERGDESFNHKPLNRRILVAVGILFGVLCAVSITFGVVNGQAGYLIPIVVFGGASLVSLVVGLLGSDRAVARIWGNR